MKNYYTKSHSAVYNYVFFSLIIDPNISPFMHLFGRFVGRKLQCGMFCGNIK